MTALNPSGILTSLFGGEICEFCDEVILQRAQPDLVLLQNPEIGGGDQLNPDLRNLIALQDIEKKVANFQKDISEIPGKILSFREEIQSIRAAHERGVAHHQELAKQRRAREGEVDMMGSKLARLKDQLMSVKTNKEYTAMLHEIQMAEDQIRREEDKILEIMEELENLEQDLYISEKEVDIKIKGLEEEIRKAEDSVPRLQAEVESLREEKSSLERVMGVELLERYRRIAEYGRGIGLAEAKDELCTMCHVRIRPQVYAELLRTDTICVCDSCSRILYLRETP